MDNWESLIASRMRPCESMPRHTDPTKERKRRAHSRNYYREHKEYFAEYQKKYRARKAA